MVLSQGRSKILSKRFSLIIQGNRKQGTYFNFFFYCSDFYEFLKG